MTAVILSPQIITPPNEQPGPEQMLQALAARNAATEKGTARKRRFQLARDLRAIERGIGRPLETSYLRAAFDEWHRLSQPFLDPKKARDEYLAAFFAELDKVRVPTGEGDTLIKALEAVSKLQPSQLPEIPGFPDAPESWRRLAALHRELSRLSANGEYFLSYRNAAKVYSGLSHQAAHVITGALARLGVIKIIRKGQARSHNGRAAEFQYLLPETLPIRGQSGNGLHPAGRELVEAGGGNETQQERDNHK
jgi:hypothetical protein